MNFNQSLKKVVAVYLYIISMSLPSMAQERIPCVESIECRKCKKQKDLVFKNNISPYIQNEKQIDIAKSNWKEVSFVDLDKDIPPLAKNTNMISVRYDGMGCIYPLFMSNDMLDLERTFTGSRDNYLFKYTFYHMFYPDHLKDHTDFLDTISKHVPVAEQRFMVDLAKGRLMHRANIDKNGNIDTLRANDIFDFADEWNSKYQSEIVDYINKIIERKGIKKIVIFIPGFNVPYALAHLQSNNIIDIYQRELNDQVKFEETLFLKIYWPSLSYKHSRLTAADFNIGNKLRLNTAKSFNFVRNRAFNVGLHARNLLANINFDGSFDIVGHSTGSDIIGIILVNPITKMNLDLNKNKVPYKITMAKRFEKADLPKKKIHAFLNAPSIPGPATFNSDVLNKPEQKDYIWTIGYNKSDKVLQKLKGTKQRANLANWGGNTSLGGDVNNTVNQTIEELRSAPEVAKNFRFVELGKQKDLFGHDFFCYLNQECFKLEFARFVKK